MVDKSDDISLIALQGPKSKELLSNISKDIEDLPYYTFTDVEIGNKVVTIGRTGYTGELGYEIYGLNETIPSIWDDIN